ncbi:MAG TPA: NADP-dependent oxidoreductase, partial [Burkholderiaceae bacterium]|nr:NADP-dependent oxidoreductase [Burkholderiaceae bacterium]
MTSFKALTNHQIRLKARPNGLPTRADWEFTTEPVSEPTDGGVLVKTLAISLDPAMRGWMNEGKSYIAPVALGEVMRAGGIGEVIASKNDAFKVGDMVSCTPGVQEYALIPADQIKRNGLFKIDTRLGTPTQWLNVLGMSGMTAYFGLLDVGMPQPGQTVVVSGAAGAVGQTVGQLAKIKGCRVVGIAGGPAKCAWVVKELGFDACVDYKAGDLKSALRDACPKGVDVYFDNVGGEILDAALAQLAYKARVVICGAISQYNATGPIKGPSNYLALLVARASMTG